MLCQEKNKCAIHGETKGCILYSGVFVGKMKEFQIETEYEVDKSFIASACYWNFFDQNAKAVLVYREFDDLTIFFWR